MKTYTLFSSALALVSLAAAAQADINAGPAPTPNSPQVRGNCDLMASNTVRAIFKGLREVPSPSLSADQPDSVQVAVFEVIENLAHRRQVRYGDGAMPAGMSFTVAMDRMMPGQPSEVVDVIGQLQPGDETVMRIDHLFLYGNPDGRFIRPCARIARRNNAPQAPDGADAASAPAPLPTTVAPLTGPSAPNGFRQASTSRSVSIRSVADGNGGFKTEKIEVVTELAPGATQPVTRMFINDVEVDPQTRQPLSAPAPAPAPAAPSAPAPAPAAPAPGAHDDTIVESDAF